MWDVSKSSPHNEELLTAANMLSWDDLAHQLLYYPQNRKQGEEFEINKNLLEPGFKVQALFLPAID